MSISRWFPDPSARLSRRQVVLSYSIAAGTLAVIGQTAGMFILALWVAIRTSVTPRDKWAA